MTQPRVSENREGGIDQSTLSTLSSVTDALPQMDGQLVGDALDALTAWLSQDFLDDRKLSEDLKAILKLVIAMRMRMSPPPLPHSRPEDLSALSPTDLIAQIPPETAQKLKILLNS